MNFVKFVFSINLAFSFVAGVAFTHAQKLPEIKADWKNWKKELGELLSARSASDEGSEIWKTSAENWSYATGAADVLRGRALFLKAEPPLPGETREAILSQCEKLAGKLMSLEASKPELQQSRSLSNKNQRGWGIERPYNLRGVIGVNTVDLWSTSCGLVALSEYLPFAKQRSPSHFKEVLELSSEVMDHWILHYSAESPLGGRYFFKIGTDDPRIKNFLIYNTESLMAIALLNLSKAHRVEGNAAKADRYLKEALDHARQLKVGVCDRIRAGGGVTASNWMYMTEGVVGTPVNSRPEDVSHGGLDPDVVFRFIKEEVRENGKPLFEPDDLRIFGKILAENVFVYDAKGLPAYSVWYKDTKANKNVYTDFLTADPGDKSYTRSTSWHYGVTDDKKRVEIGHGLRTGWGWIYGASTDANILAHTYRYYAAYLG
ncbi:MAG: hypothetical protein JNM63_11100, partial [Spirochaetia bacterium]|nr:hypothetical protein [Spirochaetia bacterium]